MDTKDGSKSPIEQENVRQDEQTVRIDNQTDGSFSSRQEENVADDAAKSEKTDKILQSLSHNQKEIVDVSKEDNEGIDKDGSLWPKEMDKVVSNATENIRIGNKDVESKCRKEKSVDDNTEKNVKIEIIVQESQCLVENVDDAENNVKIEGNIQESQCLEEKESADEAEKNVKLDEKTQEYQVFEQKENVDNTVKKMRIGDKIEESQSLEENADESMEKNVMIDETGRSPCSKDMENVVNNTTEIVRIDADSKESQYPKEKNVDENRKLNKTFIYSKEDYILKYYSTFTPRTKLDKPAEEPETKDTSASDKNETRPVEKEIPTEHLEIISEVETTQHAEEKMMLQISLDESSEKQESRSSDGSDESDSIDEIEDYYNFNSDDDILDKGDMDDDHQIKKSTPKKTFHYNGTSAPLVDVNCGETFSISGDSNNSGDISDVPTNLDGSTTENKGAKPKTYFVQSSDKDNLEPPTELLTERMSSEVRRFFLHNPVEMVEDVSPVERLYGIIASPYFSDEFAREIGINLPAVTTGNVRDDYEQRLDEMVANSKRLKVLLAVTPSTAGNRNPTRIHSTTSWTREPAAASDPELADMASGAACSAEVADPAFRVRPWADFSTELQFSYLYDEYYQAEQRQPLKLEESVESLREKQTAETEANIEKARRHLQAVGVSEEDFIRYFPIIQRKYGYVDNDQPVSELDESMDPIVEDKIVSVIFDKGSILMAVFYVELRNKRHENINSYFNEKVTEMYSEDKDLKLAIEMPLSGNGQSSGSLPLLKVNHPCLLRDVAKSIKGTTSESAHRSRPVSAEESTAIQNIQTPHTDQSMTYSPDLDVVLGLSETKLRFLEPSTDNCNFEHPTQRSDIDLSIFTTTEDENSESNFPFAIKSNFAYPDSSAPISGDTCSILSSSASENAVTRAPQAVDQSNIQDSTLESEDKASSDGSSERNMKTLVQSQEPNYDPFVYSGGEHYRAVRLIADYFLNNTTGTDSAFSSALISEETCSTARPPSSENAVIYVTQSKNLDQNIERLAVILEDEEHSEGSSKVNVPTTVEHLISVADSTVYSETKLDTTVHLTADSDFLNQPHSVITFSGRVSEETCSGTSLSTTDSHVLQTRYQADQSTAASTTQTEVELHEELLTTATHQESVDCSRNRLTTGSDFLNQPHTATTFSGSVSVETCSSTSLSTTHSRISQSREQADQSNINSSALELEHGLSKHRVQTATLLDESNIASTTQTEIELHKEDLTTDVVSASDCPTSHP